MKTTTLFHGGPSAIREFSSDFAGDTTCDNPHGGFYFSNLVDVAEDYSAQSIIRRYQDSPESLVHDGRMSQEEYEEREESGADWYDFVDEYAHENLQITAAQITFRNPFTIDANYLNLREFETRFNIQNAIGFMKGNSVDDIPEELFSGFDEETELDEEFDGLIIKNVIDNIGDRSCVYQNVHIALYNYQIDIC